MEEIASNVYLEMEFPRVVLGILKLDHGMVMIDSPFRLPDTQSWMAKLRHFGMGMEALHLLLDAHVDRTLMTHAMETDVIIHEDACDIIRNRSASSRSQELEIGPDWTHTELPSGTRFFIPRMTFSDEVLIHWGEKPLVISHRAGSHYAGAWLIHDAQKVVFVGDSVVIDQPPFLAKANLDCWIGDLNWLSSPRFEDYQIVSSRSGLIQPESIRKMAELLTDIEEQLGELSKQGSPIAGVPDLSLQLLKKMDYDPKDQDRYYHRLTRGLELYLKRHYSRQDTHIKGENE
jgi:hypothetical protein